MAPHHHQSSAETAGHRPGFRDTAIANAGPTPTRTTKTQVWQWVHHDRDILDDRTRITPDPVSPRIEEELARIKSTAGASRIANNTFPFAHGKSRGSVNGDDYQDLPACLAREHTPTVAKAA